MKMKIYSWLLMLAILLNPSAMAMDLTGHWKSTMNSSSIPGPDIYMRQIGDSVWSYGENLFTNPAWVTVTNGTVVNNTVVASWADVPKAAGTGYGTFVLRIVSENELKILNQTGGFGGANWQNVSIIRINEFMNSTNATKNTINAL
jgi:hypothetical protein